MSRGTPVAAAIAVVAVVVAARAGAARAQTPVATRPAFSVERFTHAPGGDTFVGVEGADVLPAGRWAVTLSTWLMERPIILRDVVTGDEATEPVRWRWGQEVGVARGLGDRYQLGVAVPAGVQWGDRLQGIGLSEEPLARFVLGDVRLHGRARVAGRPGQDGLAAAVAAAIVLPTGDDDQFAGEAGWMLQWGVRVGWRSPDVELTGGAALRLRTTEVVLLSPARPHGNELVGGLGAAVRIAPLGLAFGGRDRAWALAEVEGVLGDSPGTGSRGPSPAEWRLGVRAYTSRAWSVAVAGGAGFTPDELGSPGWRGLVQITYDQAPPRDRDRDGVPDGRDRCWLVAEDRDGHDDHDGCPDLDDDGDGVPDEDDRCPLEREDLDGVRDLDGCPDAEQRLPGIIEDLGPTD